MESDPKKMDFGKIEPPEKLEDENMPLPENSGQAITRLLSPTKLLSDSWQLYKSRWKTFLGIVIVPILLIVFVSLVFGIGVFGMGILGIFTPESSAINITTYLIGFVLLLALFLAMIIIQFWSQAALIYAIKDSAENIGIKESYRRGWYKIRSFFWVSILSSFIIMGGYMFFFIPGIIFAIWFSFALYIVITEDLSGMDALLKSRKYVRNYWWPVLWRFFVMGLFIYLIMIIFGIFIFLIAMLLGVTVDLNSDSFEMIINLPINIISLIFAPLMVIYPFLLYKNLKEIKGDFEFSPSAKAKRSFIAISVLGILAVAVVIAGMIFAFSTIFSSLDNAKSKAMDVARRSDMIQIKTNLIIYYDEQGKYPESLGALNIEYVDPKTNSPYEYYQLNNGNNYEICVQFEEKGEECFSSKDNAYETFDEDEYIYNDDKEKIEDEMLNNGIIGRDAQRKTDLESISLLLELHKIKGAEYYPLSPSTIQLNKNNIVVSEIRSISETTEIPLDPKDPDYYYGYRSLDGKSFELTARLENMNDSKCDVEIKRSSGICIYELQK